ncbi:MAG TPA: HipA N-terminal domain-containing protein [Bacteroidales bacterium]|nr:HipA N-terminal domain-containing protein [Bacteroidales bacterium]
MNKILRKIFWKEEGMEFNDNPKDISGKFTLKYGNMTIGFLKYEKSVWYFQYSDEFRTQELIKPIIDFPDSSKTYESDSLWPFFASRIPSINQPYQLKKIQKASVNKEDSVALLRIFGKTTINNPFQLSVNG